jgi:ATP-binding cassette subfamily B protein
MILDEATANIDTETELLIQDSLEKMMNIGTMLMVAHRLSTIQHADNIIVLSHGEIIEQGNHFELLEKRGRYYELYMLQYRKNELQRQLDGSATVLQEENEASAIVEENTDAREGSEVSPIAEEN